jgi:hypothetical protein
LVFVCSPSTTFLIGIFLILTISYLRNNVNNFFVSISKLFIFIFLFTSLVLSGLISLNETQLRVENLFTGNEVETADHLNMSSLVWLNGWSQALLTLEATNGFGVGFNQMGCGKYYDIGLYTPMIQSAFFGGMLNAEDGSFLSAKIIAEFGYIGSIIVVLLVWKSIFTLYKFVSTFPVYGSKDFEILLYNATGAICLLILLFVRSASYFMMPVLLSFSLLFSSKIVIR